MVDSTQKIRMHDPDPERRRKENRVASSRNPRDIDNIHLDGLMGVAF